jgi:stage II sporulation protein D
MKKIFIYFVLIIFVCFAIPIIFTTNFFSEKKEEKSKESNNKNTIESNYDYKKYNKIKLLHVDSKKIEEIDLDEYLYGVVSAEMPASFEEEALKAQAVVARTYTIYKIVNNDGKHKNADICDDSTCCQAWISKEDRLSKWKEDERDKNWNKIVNAVNITQGKIITYNGEPINAFFHSNSGGETEAPIDVWGGSGYPYLQSVETSGEDAYSQYSSEASFTEKEFTTKIKEIHSNFKIDFDKKDCIKVEEYTDGNRVKKIKIGNLELSGVEVRNIFGLRSANFEVNIKENKVFFKVTGYGHGVGMSQTGADSMAKQGSNYEEIIKHFYTDVKIVNM